MRLAGVLLALLMLTGCPGPKNGRFEYPKPLMNQALKNACAEVRKEKDLFDLLARYESRGRAIRELLSSSTVNVDADELERQTAELVRLGEDIQRRGPTRWQTGNWDLSVVWEIPARDVEDSPFARLPGTFELTSAAVTAFYINGVNSPPFVSLAKGRIEKRGDDQVAVFRMRRRFSTLEACELVTHTALGATVRYRWLGRERVKDFTLGVPVIQMATREGREN